MAIENNQESAVRSGYEHTLQASNAARPDEEAIRAKAYEKYRCRNGAPGDALQDWLAAESELRQSVTWANGAARTAAAAALVAAPQRAAVLHSASDSAALQLQLATNPQSNRPRLETAQA